jgi:hypothetical protein
LNDLFTNFRQDYFFVVISIPGISVAQLVQALRYTPKDRGFDFRGYHWDFSVKTRDFSWEVKAAGA